MLTTITSVEKTINDMMELKNTAQELLETYTGFNSQINQVEERISEIEHHLNAIKWEGKIREKIVKRNEQSLQEIWDYVERSNLHLIGFPESDGENETEMENTLRGIIQENFPNQQGRPTFKSRKYREHHRGIPWEEQPQDM